MPLASDSAFVGGVLERLGFELPMSANLAVVLGIRESVLPNMPVLSEPDKDIWFDSMLARIDRENEQQQEIIYSRLCADYMPAIVDRLFELPPLPEGFEKPPNYVQRQEIQEFCNPYIAAMSRVQGLPYFYKYLRSPKPSAHRARRLPELLASRIVQAVPRLNSERMMRYPAERMSALYIDIVARACCLLVAVLMAFLPAKGRREDLVAEGTRRALVPVLRDWAERYSSSTVDPIARLALAARWVLDYFEGGDAHLAEARHTREEWRGLSKCVFPLCHSDRDLRACSR